MKAPFFQSSGFSLIELLIVLVIIGILVRISYPVYTQHVQKTHRSQAQVALLDLASAMERYYAVHHSYRNATLTVLEINEYIDTSYYQLVITQATDNTYLLQAVPLNSQIQDNACGTLSLDQQGRKSISGSGEIHACWN